MIAISGNTYPVKDALKAIGGRWNPDQKAWMVPDDRADEARKLVSGAPTQSPNHYRPRTCKMCRESGIKIRRDGLCWDCAHEIGMGC